MSSFIAFIPDSELLGILKIFSVKYFGNDDHSDKVGNKIFNFFITRLSTAFIHNQMFLRFVSFSDQDRRGYNSFFSNDNDNDKKKFAGDFYKVIDPSCEYEYDSVSEKILSSFTESLKESGKMGNILFHNETA
jgi:hypothetical protein